MHFIGFQDAFHQTGRATHGQALHKPVAPVAITPVLLVICSWIRQAAMHGCVPFICPVLRAAQDCSCSACKNLRICQHELPLRMSHMELQLQPTVLSRSASYRRHPCMFITSTLLQISQSRRATCKLGQRSAPSRIPFRNMPSHKSL